MIEMSRGIFTGELTDALVSRKYSRWCENMRAVVMGGIAAIF